MKVVVAHNRYSSAQPSGENTVVDQQIATLRSAGVEVIPFLRSSDEIADLPARRKALLPLSPIYAGQAQRDLRRLLREHRPDVFHLHNPYPLLSPWVVRTAQAEGVPVIQTVHNYRQVCANGVYFRDGHICTDCQGRGYPLPAIAHACYRGSRAQSAIMATTLTLHRRTWHAVDRYLALTDAMAAHLVSYGVPRERIVVNPNSSPDPGTPPPLGDGFLFLGRLSEEKGIALLLEAWRRHEVGTLGPLRIVGDGELRHLVSAAAAERADVIFTGPTDRAGVRAALRDSSVVLAPSVWHDVLPTVILEALAAGRPVLGSPLGDSVPCRQGRLDRGADGSGIRRGAAARPGRGTLARRRRARRYLPSTFHPDVVTARLLAIYDSLPGRRE
jgi:glycosyltransferase involved in cell wall biosynthesis